MGENAQIVLASTSKYRKALLDKLGLQFSQLDPDYVESDLRGENPADKALRLARGKAEAGAQRLEERASTVVIGSDQVAECQGRILSKPGNFDKALEQLQFCTGKWVTFHTGVALVDETGLELSSFVDHYALKFRQLRRSSLKTYLHMDKPYDCAGSIKAEAHGILLIEESQGLDINSLYGLPLIKLISVLMDMNLLEGIR